MKSNELIGVMECCGAPLLNPVRHKLWCVHYEPDEDERLRIMKKMLVVEKCSDCRHNANPSMFPPYFSIFDDVFPIPHYCLKRSRLIYFHKREFPSWCPLPDAKEAV